MVERIPYLGKLPYILDAIKELIESQNESENVEFLNTEENN
jgi:hypothetical protein